MKSLTNKKNKLALIAFLLMPLINFSQETTSPQAPSVFTNVLFNALLILIVLLIVIIAALSTVIRNLGESDIMKPQNKNTGSGPSSAALLALFTLSAFSAYSETTTPVSQNWTVGGLDSVTFYFMCAVIVLELIVIASLIGVIRSFTKTAEELRNKAVKLKEKTILDQLNDAVDVENEAEILMDHDYDGIKELDNNLPPWWKYGFYLTVIVAVIYMIHYHVTKTGNLQAKEYTEEVRVAELAIAEHMKNSEGNVDENTVKMLTTEADLATGKDLFISNCAACHGKLGEGSVGPNLTDDYWVHGGSVQDVFKTVKYGWPDKGMKSWKEDFSPMQIAQITSFIKKLRGSNPPNGKEKQGDLYTEEGASANDSTVVVKDSLNVKMAADSLKK